MYNMYLVHIMIHVITVMFNNSAFSADLIKKCLYIYSI